MSVKYTTSIAFVVFLGLWALASSMPAKKEEPALSPEFEQARRLWSGARKAYKNIQRQLLSRRRTRRQVATTTGQGVANVDDLANITGPFILELYKNITNESIAATTTANTNTIRSIPPVVKAFPTCGEFNFSLSAINSTEFIIKAELHLYLTEQAPVEESYVVGIGATLENGQVIKPDFMRELRITDREGYAVFRIEDMLKNLISLGQSSATFNVKVFKSIAEFDKSEPLLCDAVKFTYQGYTDSTTPILIVYSYSKNIEKINYRGIVSPSIEQMLASGSTSGSTTSERRRRNADSFCAVHNLTIETKDISSAISDSNQVLFPLTYDAGICGGQCGGRIPENSPTNHAPFLFLLLENDTFKTNYMENHGYVFEQCCVPVSYIPLVVLAMDDAAPAINTIPDMVIDECECLDIIKFAPTS